MSLEKFVMNALTSCVFSEREQSFLRPRSVTDFQRVHELSATLVC